jgi:predicted nuclease with TOPRIM domain
MTKAYDRKRKQLDELIWACVGSYMIPAVTVAVDRCLNGKKASAEYIKKAMFSDTEEDLTEEEKYLQNEIDKYEKILNKTNNRVKIVKLKQLSLQDQNKKLIKEKEDFIVKNRNKENFDNIFLLDNLKFSSSFLRMIYEIIN